MVAEVPGCAGLVSVSAYGELEKKNRKFAKENTVEPQTKVGRRVK